MKNLLLFSLMIFFIPNVFAWEIVDNSIKQPGIGENFVILYSLFLCITIGYILFKRYLEKTLSNPNIIFLILFFLVVSYFSLSSYTIKLLISGELFFSMSLCLFYGLNAFLYFLPIMIMGYKKTEAFIITFSKIITFIFFILVINYYLIPFLN